MSTLAADVARLASLGAPILCFDTCTVLDIMRDPTRETVRDHELQAALDLLSAMETGAKLVGLVADQVRFEFGQSVDQVAEEADKALMKLRLQLARMDAVAAVFGGAARTNLAHFDNHVVRSRDVAERWMNVATSAIQAPEIESRAFRRVNLAQAPARKGKDSMKDCVVIETYLDNVSALRGAGLSSKIAFVSSNKADYIEGTAQKLRADLTADFATIGMEYVPNLAAARHYLGL
ncbi:hypothetical protein SAMN05519103_01926 [Rhizobiales bacterium GAS113]|nr:hypothetical protein SAMN05519103_01926 [Rhizobiales bacterium GAS113]